MSRLRRRVPGALYDLFLLRLWAARGVYDRSDTRAWVCSMISRTKRYRLIKRLVLDHLNRAARYQRRKPSMAKLELTAAQGVLDALVRCETKAGF